MKLAHKFQAWLLERKIQREHFELSKYVRRSAYEINAWKQDIAFLEESRAFHRSFLMTDPPAQLGKVVSIDEGKEYSKDAPQLQSAG